MLSCCRYEYRIFFFFFFSSRRRHTRWNCDWSSDVCSSDLLGANSVAGVTPECQAQNKAGFETWSVGYYNEWGGVAFGKAIPKSGVPQVATYMGTRVPAGLPFPPGTVVVKFLTTSAPAECVPYL